jgi:2-polyprenyl-3-methyl-5-hydroxy-6-metoxy-1,4-benzoquinol methylase
MYKVNCDLCENDDYKILGDVKNNKVVKCNSCGHIYMIYRFTESELLKIYDDDYFKDKYVNGNERVEYDYLKDKPNILKFVEKRFETIHKYKKPGTILDIGCAMGFYLEYAQKLGWKVYGSEISEYAANFARELLNSENIINKQIEKVEFQNEKFDVITMWLVLEHMVNPVEILTKIRKWLKKEGIIGIKVPNADGVTYRSNLDKWIKQHPEDHMCDFSPNTLERLMNKVGFKLLEVETEGIYLERVTQEQKIINNEEILKFYTELAKKCDIGDSLIMFFLKC